MKIPTPLKGLLPSFLAAGVILTALPASADLIHRYSFTGNANDFYGTANGVARNTPSGNQVQFVGGQAVLDGTGGYIDLPNGLVSGLTNITIEMWATKTENANWSRFLDFGTSEGGEDPDGTSTTLGAGGYYIFLAASVGGGGVPRFTASSTIPGYNRETPVLSASDATPTGSEVYYAITYGPNGARLIVDGVDVARGTVAIPLSTIRDTNVWLGRSTYGADAFLNGSYNEFRIHNSILTLPQLLSSKAAGPDATNYAAPTPDTIALQVEPTIIVGKSVDPLINATFPTFGAVILYGPDAVITSSATNVVQVQANGSLLARSLGTATITANVSGKTSSQLVTVIEPTVLTALRNRYSFNEASGSTTVNDSVGGASFAGTVMPSIAPAASVVVSNGQANFPGGAYATAGYIMLPPNMISTRLTNLTVEMWMTWNGPANNAWQYVWDFGNSQKGSDPHNSGNGLDYIMFTPRRGSTGARNEYRAVNGTGYTSVNQDVTGGTPTGREIHVVVTVAPSINYSALWIDGQVRNIGAVPQVGTPAASAPLSALNDVNCWIGVSPYNDPPFNGRINEFRIHEGVLKELDIALSRKAGPDALPIANPGTLQTVGLQADPIYVGQNTATQAALLGNYQNVTGVDVSGFSATVFTSTDTNVFTVTAKGAMTPVSVGTASLIATFSGLSATSSVSVLAPVSVTVTNLPATVDAGSVNFAVPLLAEFPGGVSNVNVAAYNGVTRSSSDPNVATISGGGTITVRNPGTAVITSTYGGKTNVATLTVVEPANFTRGTLVNRWSFNEAKETQTVNDSVGGKHGEIRNIQSGSTSGNFTGTGQFMMGPGAFADPPISNAYINLPNNLLSPLTSATIEGWFTYNGGSDWQRLFDFGMSSATIDGVTYIEDAVLNPGRGYMFLSMRANGFPTFAIKQGTDAETPNFSSSVAVTVSNASHFAIVYDPPHGVVRLYINGQRAGTAAATLPLSVLDDRNDWIGRSNYQDPYYNGSIDEFRIYNGPFLDSDIADHYAAGANALPVPRPTLSFSRGTGNQLVISWPVSAGNFSLKTSPVLGTAAVWTSAGTPTVVGSNNQITVQTTGDGAFYRLEQ